MTVKSRVFALLASAIFLVSAAPPEIDFAPVPMFTHVAAVRQLFCGQTRGTGFYVRTNALASANHVTEGNICGTDAEIINTVYSDAKLDYSTSTVAIAREPLEIDCAGFVDGRQYQAVGYAHGREIQRVVVASPTADMLPTFAWDGATILVGRERFIPGMSGGPVIDAITGKAVGIVKGYHSFPGISYARALKETPLCASAQA